MLEVDGYRFDMGPTILLMPSVLKRIFAEAGRDLADELELIRARSPVAFVFRRRLDARPARRSRIAWSGRSIVRRRRRGRARIRAIPRSVRDGSTRSRIAISSGGRSAGSGTCSIRRRRPALPLCATCCGCGHGARSAATIRSFVSDRRVAQMLDHFTQYVGSSPDLSPAVLCGIAHMQTGEGVWYPRGGTRAVAEALIRLAGELGVELRTGVGVRSITLDAGGGVSGGSRPMAISHVPLAAVVSNADAVRTHRELLGGEPAAAVFERGGRTSQPAPASSSTWDSIAATIICCTMTSSSPAIRTRNSTAIYRRGEPAPDPTCYLCAPAATDPAVAPPGGEALYVLVHTPYLRPHHDWKTLFPRYRQTILDKLKTTAGLADLEERIRVERWLTPHDIHDRYHVLNGAIYGLASHGRLTGAFKPANRSPDVPGLYLAGGAAHPGPGMPMVLMSGWIAANTLDGDGVVEASGIQCALVPDPAVRDNHGLGFTEPEPGYRELGGRSPRSASLSEALPPEHR